MDQLLVVVFGLGMYLVPMGALIFFCWLALRYVRLREAAVEQTSLVVQQLSRVQSDIARLEAEVRKLEQRPGSIENNPPDSPPT